MESANLKSVTFSLKKIDIDGHLVFFKFNNLMRFHWKINSCEDQGIFKLLTFFDSMTIGFKITYTGQNTQFNISHHR